MSRRCRTRSSRRSSSSAPRSRRHELSPLSPLPHEPGPHWGEVGIHGLHRLREWDAVAIVESPETADRLLRAVVLPTGDVLVEEGDDGGAPPLVAALDLRPPYRLEAVRRSATTWAVGGRSIVVVELRDDLLGTALELTWDGAERSLRVDGEPSLGSVPELEALARGRYDTWVVRAQRLRESFWEVEVDPL